MKIHHFTRVELAICCTITGVFGALFVPMMGNAALLDDTTACKANLKRMGEGAIEFTLDFDGVLPGGTLEPNQRWYANRGLHGNKGNFLYQISEYVGTDCFVCPGAKNDPEAIYTPKDPKEKCSFLVNGVLSNYRARGGVKVANVKQFDKLIYLGDRGITRIGASIVARPNPDQTHRAGQSFWNANELVHGKTFNFLFADNHVGELTPAIAKGQRGEIDCYAHYGMNADGTVAFENR